MNFGTPVPLLIGIILILGALALFFLDKVKPGYERDSDKVYAVLLLISGLFLLAHLDMELLASFQQLLMGGMLTTLLIESIRNREPLVRANDPMMNRRPPGPRYDERPPVRRGYRAELDERPEFRPRQQPMMNPAQQPYRQDGYRQDGYRQEQMRPPYEEFRGPAGRLQPSPPERGNERMNGGRNAGGPPDNRYSDNSRYGERPPAQRPPEGYRGPAGAPPIQEARVQPNDPMSNGPSNGPMGGPPPGQRYPESPNAGNRNSNGRANGADNGDSSARALNIRPRSEAPNADDNYRPNNRPEGAPS
ncbi:MAG: Ycf66 family protein [Cyanobacteria bacterium P01_D01_bin.36]